MTLSPWIPVFCTGTHTDMSRQTRTWTESDLDQIVSQFNPAQHEPPAVIGHPLNDSPAYGWVAEVKRDGQLLFARFRDFVPEFVDMVKKGLFKKRSIALFPDLTLRHVGFLGGMPPAVKGLPDVKFSDGEFQSVDFEAPQPKEDSMDEKTKTFFTTFRELLFGEGGAPIIVNQPAPVQDPAKGNQFAEQEKALKAREDKLKADEADSAKRFAEQARSLKSIEIHAFCEGLKNEGKLLPAWQEMGLEKFLMELPSEKSFKFSEGAEAKEQTPLAFMQSLLTKLPEVVKFSELAGKGGPEKGDQADPKEWAKTQFSQNSAIYEQLNVSAEMLEAIAPKQ